MKRNPLTPEDEKFIRENRHTMSMNDLSKHLNKRYNRIRTFMIDNNLQLPQEQVQQIRIKKYKEAFGTELKPSKNQDGIIIKTKNKSISTKSKLIELDNNYTPPKWHSKPWNYSLNLITMSRI